MLNKVATKFEDKIFTRYFITAVLVTIAVYFLFNSFAKNGGVWTAPLFIPIQSYILVICFLNAVLSLLVEKKDKYLAIAFNLTTISVNFLLVMAYLLNYWNPNG